MQVEILKATDESLGIIAMAISQGKFNDEFLKKLQYDDAFFEEYKKKFYKYANHGNLLEYVDIVFFVGNVSRNALDDLARHRIATFTIQSTRNKSIKKSKDILSDYYGSMINLKDNWVEGMVEGELPKDRDKWNGILPLGVGSQAICKINLRSLINMAGQRMCFRAREEIRGILYAIKTQLEEMGLEYHKLLQPKCVQLGYCDEDDSLCCGYSIKKSKAMDHLSRMLLVKDEINGLV